MKSYFNLTKSKMSSSSLLSFIPVLCSILVLQINFLPANALNVWSMTDTKTYPACLGDEECVKFDTRKQKSKNYHACFQYFCYPWNEEPKTADKTKPAPFKSCRMNKDCKTNGEKTTCFRHPDKRRIGKGICVKEDKVCDSHEECKDFGGKCCSGHCCNDVYFKEIKNLECFNDEGCQDILAGDRCCMDLSGAGAGWESGKSNWSKKCCMPSNEHSVIPPPKDPSEKLLKKIDTQIGNMIGMTETVCKAMDYDQMIKYSHCQEFTTTTTTTTPTTTTTKKTTTTVKAKPITSTDVSIATSSITISYSTATKLVLTIISFNLLFFPF